MLEILAQAPSQKTYFSGHPTIALSLSTGQTYAVAIERRAQDATFREGWQYAFIVRVPRAGERSGEEVLLEAKPLPLLRRQHLLNVRHTTICYQGRELCAVRHKPFRLRDVLVLDGEEYPFPTVLTPRIRKLGFRFSLVGADVKVQCPEDDARLVLVAMALACCLWIAKLEKG